MRPALPVSAKHDEVCEVLLSPTTYFINDLSIDKLQVDRSCIVSVGNSEPLQNIPGVVPAQIPFDRVGMNISQSRFQNPKKRHRQPQSACDDNCMRNYLRGLFRRIDASNDALRMIRWINPRSMSRRRLRGLHGPLPSSAPCSAAASGSF